MNELKANVGTSGLSTVAVELFSNDLTEVWNTTLAGGAGGWESYVSGHLSAYEIAANELPSGAASGIYAASMPTGVAAGLYFYRAINTAGPTVLTTLAAIDWNGSAEVGNHNGIVAGYAGGEDPATLMAAAGYTSTRAAALDTVATNLDVKVSTRSTYVGNDPWATNLPGSYAAGTAGNIVGSIVQDMLEADRWIDTSVSPWAFVLIKKGSGPLGSGTELLRQKLYDTSGAAIAAASTVIGRSIT